MTFMSGSNSHVGSSTIDSRPDTEEGLFHSPWPICRSSVRGTARPVQFKDEDGKYVSYSYDYDYVKALASCEKCNPPYYIADCVGCDHYDGTRNCGYHDGPDLDEYGKSCANKNRHQPDPSEPFIDIDGNEVI